MTSNDETAWTEFHDTVNMTAKELEKWLETDQSKQVGQKSGGKESTGHQSGRHIIAILKAKKSDLTDSDYAHMRKVVGYARRHLAQRPSGDVQRHRMAVLIDELGPRSDQEIARAQGSTHDGKVWSRGHLAEFNTGTIAPERRHDWSPICINAPYTTRPRC